MGALLVPAGAWVTHDGATEAKLQVEAFAVPAMDGVVSRLWLPECFASTLACAIRTLPMPH
ncbi:MAG: hypothetical protein H6806_10965 [Planctomycetes bacterium]|nr:hypothetical protein [Planctomycetota bacterium]